MSLLSQFSQADNQRLQDLESALTEPSVSLPSDIVSLKEMSMRLASKASAVASEVLRLGVGIEDICERNPRGIVDLATAAMTLRITQAKLKDMEQLDVGGAIYVVVDPNAVRQGDLTRIKKLIARYNLTKKRADEIQEEMIIVNKALTKAAKEALNKEKLSTQATTIPTKDIPKTILIPNRKGRGFDNPYFDSKAESGTEYAGSAVHYDFGPMHTRTFNVLRDALQDNGITDFNTCFASTRYANGTNNRLFIVMTPDAKVVWRRNGTGPSAQNNVYLNGQTVQTSALLNMSPSHFTATLKHTGVIK